MSLSTVTVSLAGLELAGAKDDDGKYYVAVPSLEKALDEKANSTRKKENR